MANSYTEVESTARTYYNSGDADAFYFHVWGGEDIHVGIYQHSEESIFSASRRTVEKMSSYLENVDPTKQILDIGAGYGGSARFLSEKFSCKVDCLNISEEQNARNRNLNKERKLDGLVKVIDGSFEEIPSEDACYDIVWSQDAILHSGKKEKVFQEVSRVLKPGAEFIFTDPMQSKDAKKEELKPVLERIHLESMGYFEYYEDLGRKYGLSLIQKVDLTENLIRHYTRILEEVTKRYEELTNGICSKDYMDRMKQGLNAWIKAGESGNLNWGILHFKKV